MKRVLVRALSRSRSLQAESILAGLFGRMVLLLLKPIPTLIPPMRIPRPSQLHRPTTRIQNTSPRLQPLVLRQHKLHLLSTNHQLPRRRNQKRWWSTLHLRPHPLQSLQVKHPQVLLHSPSQSNRPPAIDWMMKTVSRPPK